MIRERSRVASSSEYSGKAFSPAPGVRKKFGCEPAATTSASPVQESPSAAVTVREAGSIDATSASLTSTPGWSWNSRLSENATSLGARSDVATW